MNFLIICVGSKKYGYGHIRRSTILQKFLNKNNYADLLIFTEKNNCKNKRRTRYQNIKKFSKVIDNLNLGKYNFIIFDISNHIILKKNILINYLRNFSLKYRNKIIFIDGLKNEMIEKKKIKKRLLICPYFLEKKDISKSKDVKYLIGPKYFILDEKFGSYKKISVKKKVKNILITCGGSDLEFNSLKFLKLLKRIDLKLIINVIIGPFFSTILINKLKKELYGQSNIKLIYNPNNLWKLFMKSDAIISSSGITKYEVLSIGTPSIIFTANVNQKKYNQGFANKNITLTINSSEKKYILKKKIKNFLINYKLRRKYFIKSKKVVDFKGCERILNTIKNLKN